MTNYKALWLLYSILYAVSIDNELWAKRGENSSQGGLQLLASVWYFSGNTEAVQ